MFTIMSGDGVVVFQIHMRLITVIIIIIMIIIRIIIM